MCGYEKKTSSFCDQLLLNLQMVSKFLRYENIVRDKIPVYFEIRVWEI